MSVYHTIGDVIKRTNLEKKFAYKCVKSLKDILNPTRGVNNALQFDNNAMAIFDQIAQKRKNNLSLDQIEQAIRKELKREKPLPNGKEKQFQTEGNQGEPGGQTEANQKEFPANAEPYEVLKLREKLLNQKEEFQTELFAQKEDILERDRVILEKDIEIQDLNNRVLLLESPKQNTSRLQKVLVWILIVIVLVLVGGGLYFVDILNAYAVNS